jgi:hypothetical protein
MDKLFGGSSREVGAKDIQEQSGRQQDLLTEMASMPPMVPNVDITGLAQLTETLNRLKQIKDQGARRPDILAAEALADKSILSDAAEYDAGRVPHGGQSALARLGLGGAINTGAGLGSTFGKQTAASIFGKEFEGKRMGAMDRAARWALANPAPDIGMSGETAGNIRAAAPFNLANVLNPARSELLGATFGAFGNDQNLQQKYIELAKAEEEARKQRNNAIVTAGLGAAAKAGAFA